MLKQRILTALLLAPVVLLLIYYGDEREFGSLVALVQLLNGYEWLRMHRVRLLLNLVINLLLTGLIFYISVVDVLVLQPGWFGALTALVWLPALLWLRHIEWGRTGTEARWIKIFLGILGIMLFAFALNSFHASPNGHLWTLFLFLLIWVADTGAYISGKSFGRHKLAPAISPGKTWEGVLGAVTLVALYAWGVAWYMQVDPLLAMPVFALVALFSVAGDLCASLAKRHAGIKDSSNLLPGHGGFIDRFDSLIAATPVFSLLLQVLV